MKRLSGFLAAFVLLLLTSCETEVQDSTTTQEFTRCFAHVTELSTGKVSVSEASYQVILYMNARTADVLISNLTLTDGTKYPLISLKDVPWSQDAKQWVVIKGTKLRPTGAGTNTPEINDFEFRFINRMLDGAAIPGLSISYTMGDKCKVFSSFTKQALFGTTTTTATVNGQQFETQDPGYIFQFDMAKGTVNIRMDRTSLMPGMPYMNIDLIDVPFTINGTTASWNVEQIIPTIGGDPYPNNTLLDFKGSLNFGTGLTMQYSCKPAKAPGTFLIDVDCDYNYLPGL